MVIETPTLLAPIFNDIKNCKLASVNWVIPDGRWSDHAGEGPTGNLGWGPAYVAAIVNAIGQGNTCDGYPNGGYWNDTVILITWDDWGGWYDHVAPFKIVNDGTSWGSGYAYGFRVPLLVVSGLTKAGTVSNTTHDFGSILRFVENNFGLNPIAPAPYTYADSNAPDYPDSLGDFFNSQTPLQFQPIPLSAPYSSGMDANYFMGYYDGDPPADPDMDASEGVD